MPVQTLLKLFLLASSSTAVLAQGEPSPEPSPVPIATRLFCTNVEKACQTAGFRKFGHNGTDGLWQNCMQPLLNGQEVAKVKVDQVDVKGCIELGKKSNK